MLYIKVLSDSDVLLAAEEFADPVFVKYQERNKIVIACKQEQAQGIVSADGSIIYQLDEKPALPEGAAEKKMRAKIISKYEYADCVEALGDIDSPEPVEPEDGEPEGDGQDNTPMNVAQMRAKIIEMDATIQELSERNTFLEDCILEMSEVVYA